MGDKRAYRFPDTPLNSVKEPRLHQLDDSHLSSVAAASAGTGHASVAAVAVSVLGGDLLEQLVSHIFLASGGLLEWWQGPGVPLAFPVESTSS